jgi:hypothetical protein
MKRYYFYAGHGVNAAGDPCRMSGLFEVWRFETPMKVYKRILKYVENQKVTEFTFDIFEGVK